MTLYKAEHTVDATQHDLGILVIYSSLLLFTCWCAEI